MTVTASMSTSGLLDEVLLRGRELQLDVARGVLAADFSVALDMIGELALSLYDPEFAILESGLLTPGGAVSLQAWRQEITATETAAAPDGHGQVTIRCRSAAIGRLRRRRGPKVMQKASPSDFVKSECKAVGAKFVIQSSAKRRSVARDTAKSVDGGSDERPSSWSTFERLARELGYALFESENTVYFGKPSWLRKRDGTAAVVTWDTGEPTDCVGVPVFRDELDPTEEGVSVTFDVPRERIGEFGPGARVTMDFPVFGEQTYLVTALAFPVLGPGLASVSAGLPVDPKPEPPSKAVKAGDRAGAGTSGAGGPALVRGGKVGSRRLGDLLRAAGFTGAALNVAAGVAIAESGGASGGRAHVDAHAVGDTGLVDAKWGPSIGVFQIRSLKNPGAYGGTDALRDAARLRGALFNAQTAYKISGGGRNWGAWSAYTSGRYRAFVGMLDAEVRNWGGVPRPAAASPGPSRPGSPPNPTGATGRKSAFDFVNLCLRQTGDRYVFGAEASPSDADPDAFDCSELIEWAARRVGCFIPDGSSAQIAYCRGISVAQGRATRGALLWIPGHIAVSLGGNAGTIEAANPSYGVARFGPSRSFSWQRAGLIPGMRYG